MNEAQQRKFESWLTDIRDHSGLPAFAKFAKRSLEKIEEIKKDPTLQSIYDPISSGAGAPQEGRIPT